jgi:hypothetical protein
MEGKRIVIFRVEMKRNNKDKGEIRDRKVSGVRYPNHAHVPDIWHAVVKSRRL